MLLVVPASLGPDEASEPVVVARRARTLSHPTRSPSSSSSSSSSLFFFLFFYFFFFSRRTAAACRQKIDRHSRPIRKSFRQRSAHFEPIGVGIRCTSYMIADDICQHTSEQRTVCVCVCVCVCVFYIILQVWTAVAGGCICTPRSTRNARPKLRKSAVAEVRRRTCLSLKHRHRPARAVRWASVGVYRRRVIVRPGHGETTLYSVRQRTPVQCRLRVAAARKRWGPVPHLGVRLVETALKFYHLIIPNLAFRRKHWPFLFFVFLFSPSSFLLPPPPPNSTPSPTPHFSSVFPSSYSSLLFSSFFMREGGGRWVRVFHFNRITT